MFKYYLGISVMCGIFSIAALFFSKNTATVASIFFAMAGAFLAVAFLTSSRESRW